VVPLPRDDVHHGELPESDALRRLDRVPAREPGRPVWDPLGPHHGGRHLDRSPDHGQRRGGHAHHGPIAGALVAIPTYFIARRFVDRFAALAAVVVLALLPGTFFSYSLVGFPDHSAAEVLFQSLAILAFLVAVAVAEREAPVWELVVDRDWAALKRPAAYAAAAGVALGLYMWTWQPGALVVGFTGVFLAIKITSDVSHGKSPEPVAFAGAVSMVVAGLMQIVPLDTFRFAVSEYSLLQIDLPLGVALGAVFLAWLARQWESRDLDAATYPPAVGGLILASAGVVWLAIPRCGRRSPAASSTPSASRPAPALAPSVRPSRPSRTPPSPTSSSASTASRSSSRSPPFSTSSRVPLPFRRREPHALHPGRARRGRLRLRGPQLYDAIGGVVGVSWQVIGLLIAAALLVGATFLVEYDAEELYFVVWAAFIGSAAFTQVRFNYYLAVIVAVGAAYFVQLAVDFLRLRSLSGVRDIGGGRRWGARPRRHRPRPARRDGDAGVGRGREHRPRQRHAVGREPPVDERRDAHAGRARRRRQPHGAVRHLRAPADGDFEYPEGAYGVQSWWDYGHWITTRAERIPNANPFQQNAGEAAADYLLAPSEEASREVLASQPEHGGREHPLRDGGLADGLAELKFGAPVTFYSGNETRSDFNRVLYQQTEQGGFQTVMQVNTQRYHESQMIRLYEHYGSAVDPQPVVVDWETQSAQTASGDQIEINTLPSDPRATIRQFDNVSAARAYVEEDGSAQLGGVGDLPSERVEALEHHRLVHASEAPGRSPSFRQVQILQQLGVDVRSLLGESGLAAFRDDFVKTFERVPGATIEGSGAAPGEEVEATVELEKATGGTFEYTQYAEADENGNFEFTVPYSTTGYDEFGPENGYTNTSVRATGPYNITTAQTTDDLTTTQRVGQVEVTEGQVVGADDAAATVELTEEVIDCPSGDPECSIDGSGADGGDGSGSETATVDSATVIADATGVDATTSEGASA